MSLTKCPECRRLCFSEAASCPTCLRAFDAGELNAKVTAEERTFNRKWNIIFLAIFLVLMGALTFVVFRPQPTGLPGNTNIVQQRAA